VERAFGGAVPLTGEIVSNRGQAALSDHQFVHKVLKTERELERVPGIKSAFSIFDLATGINKMITGENTYPQNPMIKQLILMQLGQEGIKTWVSDDGLRLMVRTQNISSSQIAKLEEFVTEHPDTIRIITGMPALFFSPLRVRLQAASVMWVAMVVSSMAALLLIPIFYSFSRSR
jgi:hypothetical protein